MGYSLIAFTKLSLRVEQSIIALIDHHSQNEKKLCHVYDEKKIINLLEQLPKERRIQAQFLMTVKHVLAGSNYVELEKTKIITGAAYFIREKIASTYRLSSPEHSNFYNSLTTALDLHQSNQPQISDVHTLYTSLKDFLLSQIYNDSDPRRGYIEKHPFSSEIIKEYSVEEDIKFLAKESLILFEKIMDIEKEKSREKKYKYSKKDPGLFSVKSKGVPMEEIAELEYQI